MIKGLYRKLERVWYNLIGSDALEPGLLLEWVPELGIHVYLTKKQVRKQEKEYQRLEKKLAEETGIPNPDADYHPKDCSCYISPEDAVAEFERFFGEADLAQVVEDK